MERLKYFYLFSKNELNIKVLKSILDKKVEVSVLKEFDRELIGKKDSFFIIDVSCYAYFEVDNFLKILNTENILILSSGNYKKLKLVSSLGLEFCLKPFDYNTIIDIITNKDKNVKNYKFCDNFIPEIVGKSVEIIKLKKKISVFSKSMKPVLIVGETGTGKELVARSIHNLSQRKDKKLITVNCSSLSNSLNLSTLFGSVEGAFTDARNSIGKFELADKSSLFLDEIGELDYKSQSLLLRVLEDNKVSKLGSNIEKEISVRIISATNINFKEAIERKEFRQDLYYRLSSLKIEVPPLRDRKDDIPILVNHFLKESEKDYEISLSSIEKLQNHSWPGNIRELRNVIHNAALMSKNGIIKASDISIED